MKHADEVAAARTGWALARNAVKILAFWTALGLAFSVPAYLMAAPAGGRERVFHALKAALPQWYAWGALFPLVRLLDRVLLRTKQLATRLTAHLPLSILFTTAWLMLRAAFEMVLGKAFPSVSLDWYAGQLAWHLPTYWLIFGMWAARQYHDEGQQRAIRNAELQATLVETRLLVLRAQLHPHFLFNALNAVSALMERDTDLARRMLADLGDLLRIALDSAEKGESSLADEMRFVGKYLDIQRIRFGDRLRTSVDVASEVWGARLPTLILQPLIENAIIHGVGPRASGGSVSIRAWREHDSLCIQIDDDGVGVSAAWLADPKEGVGLRNVRERLGQLYPEAHRFILTPRLPSGLSAQIQLPLRVA